MKFKVKLRRVSTLSRNQICRVYESGMREMVKRPTLVRVLLKDYKTKEDVNALLEQLSEASRAAEQDLYAEYPKLPRKAKKELKKRLNADNNSKLLARIYLNRQNSRRVVLRGYYDFDKEKFYISSISKKANTRSVMKFLLKTTECSRFHWEYSGNYDDKLYQEWLKEHAVFNRL